MVPDVFQKPLLCLHAEVFDVLGDWDDTGARDDADVDTAPVVIGDTVYAASYGGGLFAISRAQSLRNSSAAC